MGPQLERIFDGTHGAAETLLPAHFGTTRTHLAAELTLQPRKQHVQLHFTHRMQIPEATFVLLHAETRIHTAKRIQAFFHMMVVFGTKAFHAGLQQRLILVANRRLQSLFCMDCRAFGSQ